MRVDLWRLAGGLTLGLVLGWLAGWPLLGSLLALLSLYLYQLYLCHRLLLWFYGRGSVPALSQSSLLGEFVQQVDFLRTRYRRRLRRLTEMLARDNRAIGALPDAIVMLDAEGQVEWANQNATEMLGVRWPQDEACRIAHLLRHPALVEGLRPDADLREEQQLELISMRRSGIVLEMRIIPCGYRQRLLFARDVTARRNLEAMRQRFIADASHELRTPLTILSSVLETLEQEAQRPAEWGPMLQQMRAQVQRMSELIHRLLELSALESEARTKLPVKVDVCALFQQLRAELKLAGIKQQVHLQCESRQGVLGHSDEIYSAVSNLVQNALRHTVPGGKIQLRWYIEPGGAFLEVEDNGTGIAAEHLPRLGERFYRVNDDRRRDRGGTGLGLSIVQQVLRRHDAFLHVESTLGRGSRFRCSFPLDRISALS